MVRAWTRSIMEGGHGRGGGIIWVAVSLVAWVRGVAGLGMSCVHVDGG